MNDIQVINKKIKNNKSKYIMYKILLLFIFSIVIIMNNCTNIYGNSITDYQKEIENIKNQQKANTEKLDGIDKEISQEQYEIIDLDEKITTISTDLSNVQAKVDTVNAKLADLESSLQNSAQEYNSAEELYAIRLRTIYENGMPSIIDVLFSAKGVSDFFSKVNVLNSILDYDKSLVGNIQSQKEYIDYIKSDIQVQKVQLEQLKYDVEKSSQALDDARVAKEQKINTLVDNKTTLTEVTQALEKQKQQAINKLNEEISKLAQLNTTFAGKFAWPIPGKYYISAKFKENYNVLGMPVHYGTDVPAPIGTKILAMESGTVVISGYNSGGYGNYVVIDHGYSDADGVYYRTLYGHASSLLVTKGEKVTKGQAIALVGNTGNSTGPHLHIEVRKNNVQVDTMDYFKGSGISFTYGSSRIPYPFN